MIFVDLNFDELLGLFFVFACLIFVTIVLFGGIMRIFENFFDEKIDRLFHYHYHYKDRRR
jgi:hypothetical protein